MNKPSRFLSVLCSLLTALALLTGAVAVPILWRGFYYMQMSSLRLAYRTGFSQEAIRGAFDQVMDYLVKGAPFGTGSLKWSEAGMAHFADCRVLFRLDFVLLAVSLTLLLLLGILLRTGRLSLHHFRGKGPCFWAFVGMVVVLLALLAWALADFDSLFTAFHTLFFPGKTNWLFDWRTDEIILILPVEFWARTAALVGALAFGGGAVLAIIEAVRLHGRPRNVYEELRQMRRQ